MAACCHAGCEEVLPCCIVASDLPGETRQTAGGEVELHQTRRQPQVTQPRLGQVQRLAPYCLVHGKIKQRRSILPEGVDQATLKVHRACQFMQTNECGRQLSTADWIPTGGSCGRLHVGQIPEPAPHFQSVCTFARMPPKFLKGQPHIRGADNILVTRTHPASLSSQPM
jgi:hypothetical protein